MVIEIDKGDADQDAIIEVDNPYPDICVELVSKPATGTVSSYDSPLSTYGFCY